MTTACRRFLSLALTVTSYGCHQISPGQSALLIHTPPEVRLDTGVVSIMTSFINSSKDTVMVSMCAKSLEYLDDKIWKVVDMTPCAGMGDPAWAVPPRDSLVMPMVKYDSRDMRILVRRGPLVTGVYRLGFNAYVRNLRIGRQDPSTQVTSNSFRIYVNNQPAPPSAEK